MIHVACARKPSSLGSLWTDFQSSIPADGFALSFTVYADKTTLSPFGSIMGYPVYAQINNLPSEVRNGTGIGGGRLVGWLPIVSGQWPVYW